MDCICGKRMSCIGETKREPPLFDIIKIWACPPDGCGRIFLEGSESGIKGTYYLPEVNKRWNILG
jgi:hypothetical protein